MKEVPMIPKEYIGNIKKDCGYTKTQPREWTEKEIEWVLGLLKKGYTTKEIAKSLNRSETSVSIKIKRISKRDNTYNKKHIQEKMKYNYMFLDIIKPKTVLDLYCGENNFYKEYKTTTNDINKEIQADYNMDALKLICKLYYEGMKYDLVDLDPFGSAYDCFDLAIKIAKKGIVITFGELGHKRWKRLDFVRTHYSIENLEDFKIETLVKYVQQIGLRNKKRLIPVYVKEWENIGRAYFKIENIKITEQWEKKE